MNFVNLLKPLRLPSAAQQFGMADWVWVVVFILALILVWWLLSRSTKRSESEAEELSALITEEQAQIDEENVEEELEEEIIPTEPDDLTRIEGIGPKISQLLGAAGISTFAQPADADADLIDSKLDEAGITFADPGTWPDQAKLASEGKWEELERLQDSLKGGRKE
jgi:predicted flap endonuclease-1-like 5' DNA nuclease